MEQKQYDYRNCQSLFGYAATVHRRSGGICQLCGCGGGRLDFDLWRQLTVEHVIGESQGGYLPAIRDSLRGRFPEMPPADLAALAAELDEINTVTACSFCNATTSRDHAPIGLPDVLMSAPADPEGLLNHVRTAVQDELKRKRSAVKWKLAAVRHAYEEQVVPGLTSARTDLSP